MLKQIPGFLSIKGGSGIMQLSTHHCDWCRACKWWKQPRPRKMYQIMRIDVLQTGSLLEKDERETPSVVPVISVRITSSKLCKFSLNHVHRFRPKKEYQPCVVFINDHWRHSTTYCGSESLQNGPCFNITIPTPITNAFHWIHLVIWSAMA